MFLLDTNICIYAMKGRYPALAERLLTVHPREIAISSITAGELAYGAAKSRWGETTRLRMQMFLAPFTLLPFTGEDAAVFGELRASPALQAQPIGPYDLLIAAQGVSRELTVVTHNTAEFARVPGIDLTDWTLPEA